jgi:hypothetical protein
MEGHMIRAGETIAGGPGNGRDNSGARGPHGPKDAITHPGQDKGGPGNGNTPRSGQLTAGLEQKGDRATTASVPIVFDHRSQSFMTEHEVVHGDNMRTVTEPVGSFLARSGGSFGGQQGEVAGPHGGPGFNPTSGGTPGYRGGGALNGGNDPRGYSGGGGYNGAGNSAGSRGGGGGYNPGGSNSGSGNSGGSGGGSHGGSGGGSFGGGGSSPAPSSGGSAPTPSPK